jgi:hypothetical protein
MTITEPSSIPGATRTARCRERKRIGVAVIPVTVDLEAVSVKLLGYDTTDRDAIRAALEEYLAERFSI